MTTKHPHAISGKVFTERKERESKIRKRSSEDFETRKRERAEDLTLVTGRNSEEEIEMPGEVELEKKIVEALMSPTVTNHWKNILNSSIDTKITEQLKPMKTEITDIKKQVNELNERYGMLKKIELKLDEHDMRERDNNIIVEGLKEESKEGIVNELNELLELEMKITDIQTAYKLTNKTEADTKKNAKTKVVLRSKAVKEEIMKAKIKLIGKPQWINDDLTPERSGLAFEARQAARSNKIEKTWVHNGKIFIKKLGDDQPQKINTKDDIPM